MCDKQEGAEKEYMLSAKLPCINEQITIFYLQKLTHSMGYRVYPIVWVLLVEAVASRCFNIQPVRVKKTVLV